MDRITVRGRGFRDATCKVVPAEQGLTLRIDDTRNPELWVEVFISNDALARIHAAQFMVPPWAPDLAADVVDPPTQEDTNDYP